MRLLILFLFACPCFPAPAYEDGRAAFSVRVNDIVIPYRIFAVYALPGETLSINALETDMATSARDADGPLLSDKFSSWTWLAPSAPGVHALTVASGADEISLNVVVMHPAKSVVDGRLNGFRIGRYPHKPHNNDPVYLAPDGYIELNDQTASLELSPNFRLSQFP